MESRSPLVSIITIVYNGERHLLSCINSVKNQGYQNYEHVIVDGDSQDKTLSILMSNVHSKLKYISERDRGISDAFNKGLKLVKGEIVAILNVDDLYDADSIETLIDFYNRNGRKSGVYYGDITYFNGDIRYQLRSEIRSIWKYMSLFHPSCFVTRDIYERFGGFDTDYKYAMDCELFHRFLFNGVPFFYVENLNVNFRLEGCSDKHYRNSLKEFYRSSSKYNYRFSLEFHYRFSLLKKLLLKSKAGRLLQPYYRKLSK